MDWVARHQDWAGPVAFLLAFTESLPVVGFFIPGSALLFAAGMLILSGVLPAWPVLLGAGLGAALGDSTGYLMARHWGPGVVRRHLPRRHWRLYARARIGFRRWGLWAVFLSRFFAPLRAFIPVVAGLSGMRHWHFQLANLPSAVVWAPLLLMPGQAVGWFSGTVSEEHLPIVLLTMSGMALAAWRLLKRPPSHAVSHALQVRKRGLRKSP
nr:DedA family protein [Roseomonas marmotae]